MPLLFDFLRVSGTPDPGLVRAGLHPPLPIRVSRPAGGSERRLVWGRPIAEAALAEGLDSIPVREFDESELSMEDALVLLLRLENRRDRYTPREIEALGEILEDLGVSDADGRIGGLVSSKGELRQAGRRRRLRPILRALASEEKIDLKTAESLGEIPEGLLALLGGVLEVLSFSERRIFLTALKEVLLRDRPADPTDLGRRLASAENPAALLRSLRYPELSSMEERFGAISGRFFKGSGIVLKHPPYFEGRRFSVSFEFESPVVLERKLKVLQKFQKEGNELYDLL